MTDGQKKALIAAGVALAAFLVGFGWQFIRAEGLAGELEAAEREATFGTLEGTLGAATIEAQRASYEIARQLASEFFGGLQTGIDRATVETRPALDEILAQRDAMITALSRSDPQSGSLMAQLFMRYRLAFGKRVGPSGTETTVPRPDTPTLPPPDTPADTLPTDTLPTDTLGATASR
jgi:hypothetical protein